MIDRPLTCEHDDCTNSPARNTPVWGWVCSRCYGYLIAGIDVPPPGQMAPRREPQPAPPPKRPDPPVRATTAPPPPPRPPPPPKPPRPRQDRSARRAKVAELRGQGWTWRRIAAALGISDTTAKEDGRVVGAKRPPRPPPTAPSIYAQQRARAKQQRVAVLALRAEQRLTDAQIAKQVGITIQELQTRLNAARRAGIAIAPHVSARRARVLAARTPEQVERAQLRAERAQERAERAQERARERAERAAHRQVIEAQLTAIIALRAEQRLTDAMIAERVGISYQQMLARLHMLRARTILAPGIRAPRPEATPWVQIPTPPEVIVRAATPGLHGCWIDGCTRRVQFNDRGVCRHHQAAIRKSGRSLDEFANPRKPMGYAALRRKQQEQDGTILGSPPKSNPMCARDDNSYA